MPGSIHASATVKGEDGKTFKQFKTFKPFERSEAVEPSEAIERSVKRLNVCV
jgi:hypothetical protein